ncbi:hypothetical protein [Noviherbaspirillum sp.]|uniref:hypothetical protein n=1 Tax=Noviherbaspirillum sp. TaxID=1926288 RepID=UPI002D48F336|nr:hypothetical protein [Noviherbaspirillum sp.]HZW23464.1 hypothetical protein [Noviherbaspirillum sp.]
MNFPAPRSLRYTALIALAISSAACSRSSENTLNRDTSPASSPAAIEEKTPSEALSIHEKKKMQQEELMGAIFQNGYQAEQGRALAEIGDIQGGTSKYSMTIVSNADLEDGRTIVVVNGVPIDDDGNEQYSHASPGFLNVYFLERDGRRWRLVERRENIATMGSNGRIGSITWVMLAPHKPGFIVSTGGTWHGNTIRIAEIYDVANGVVGLGSLKEYFDNVGSCMEDTEECWRVESTLQFVDGERPSFYRDIHIEFSSSKFTIAIDKDGAVTERTKVKVKDVARYRFDGVQYKLIAGANPVADL